MPNTRHPDGPDSPAAIAAERMADAIADATAPLESEIEHLKGLVRLSARRLQQCARLIEKATTAIDIPRDALEHNSLSDLRATARRTADELNIIASSMWTGECPLADFLDTDVLGDDQ